MSNIKSFVIDNNDEPYTRWECDSKAVVHSFLEGYDSFICLVADTGEVVMETPSLQEALIWIEKKD